ncbi:hypothetical protein IIQ43_18225 [Acinetobacter oleivorans]|uniref:Uncharacterized protein n=1 Tax=Acinetobacter oleivorans TaxID=1148157 RepID=A0ABR9NNX6_9GAMM|nr:hypothetical protein [Acinetobacter oleivorans]MBE2166460.1 hypothetical protein [Acinetobacter oleivorans]
MIISHYDFSEIQFEIEEIIKVYNFNVSEQPIIKSILKLFYIFKKVHKINNIVNKGLKETLENKEIIEKNVDYFICFIYKHHYSSNNKTKYTICILFLKIIKRIFKEKILSNVQILPTKETIDLVNKIKNYNKIKVDERLLNFYKPWTIKSSNKKIYNINLSNIYIKFGFEFCDKYYNIVKKIAATQINTSLTRTISSLYALNRLFCETFKNHKELQESLNSSNTQNTFYKFYNILIVDNIKNNYSLIYFHNRWRQYVNTYMLLIENDLFPNPIGKISTPKFKTSTNQSHQKVKTGKIVNDKLIFDIPLTYTDNIAKERIFKKINYDIDLITMLSKKYSEKIVKKYNNYYNLKSHGKLLANIYNPSNLSDIFYTYAHLYQNNLTCKYKLESLRFSKININGLIPNLSQKDIYPFLILLVKEHPQITESWLTEWKLYKNDKFYGYIKENNNFYIVSHKRRKRHKSLQKILLNDKSKNIIDDLIKITTINRDYLKSRNDSDYEYMLLINTSIFVKPKKINKLYNPTTKNTFKYFYDLFSENSIYKEENKQEQEYAINLAKSFSLTKFRATCAVQIYIETNSIQAMSQALGHENIDKRLIGAYLPTPLWDYFTERWIRIYQNVLIYEAMKDSPYLLKAIDVTAETLDVFIENHHFGDLPEYLKYGKYNDDRTNSPQNNLGIFAISIPLLQWFLAIIEWSKLHELHDQHLIKWYECAVLVISQIELSISSEKVHGFALYLDEKIFEMYEVAKKNPIDTKIIEGVLRC